MLKLLSHFLSHFLLLDLLVSLGLTSSFLSHANFPSLPSMNRHDLSSSVFFVLFCSSSLRVVIVNLDQDFVVVLRLLLIEIAQPEHDSNLMSANLGVAS